MSSRLRWWVGLVSCTLLACAIAFVGLGDSGFHSTEGHRVVPGLEMLESGEPFPTRMFETAYVRKPVGTPWLIALSSSLFGETEYAARVPSALAFVLMTAAVYVYGVRWFGLFGGLVGGFAQALSPQLWMVSRTAEIESVFLLGVLLLCLSVVDVAVRGRCVRLLGCVSVAMCGGVLMFATKGPAGVPACVGLMLAAGLLGSTQRVGARSVLVGGVGLVAGASFLLVTAAMTRDAIGDEQYVAQSLGAFVWNLDRMSGVAGFPFVLFAAGVPLSLGLLFAWGGDAKAEAESGGRFAERSYTAGRVLTIGWVFGVIAFMLALVENNRYGLPSQMLLAPLAGYVGWGVEGGYGAVRVRIAKLMMLGHPVLLGALLTAGALWWVGAGERAVMPESGLVAGVALGGVLSDGDEVWAEGCVEARPEVLLYAKQSASDAGRTVRMRWMKWALREGEPAPVGTVLVLRGDKRKDAESEFERYVAASGIKFEEIWRGNVHIFEYVAVRVIGSSTR